MRRRPLQYRSRVADVLDKIDHSDGLVPVVRIGVEPGLFDLALKNAAVADDLAALGGAVVREFNGVGVKADPTRELDHEAGTCAAIGQSRPGPDRSDQADETLEAALLHLAERTERLIWALSIDIKIGLIVNGGE